MTDSYTADSIKVLVFLRQLNGSLKSSLHAFGNDDIAEKMHASGMTVSKRHVQLAIEEAAENGLVQARTHPVDEAEDGYFYSSIDITGQGLRFLESLEYLAKQEGKTSAWLWSMVQKAASLSQLLSFVMKAVEAL